MICVLIVISIPSALLLLYLWNKIIFELIEYSVVGCVQVCGVIMNAYLSHIHIHKHIFLYTPH